MEPLAYPPSVLLAPGIRILDSKTSLQSPSTPQTPAITETRDSLRLIESTVVTESAVDDVETTASKRRHTLRVLTGFFVIFACGWGDGVTGVVLPYIKQQFQLSYTLSSLLFVSVSVGYVITAFTLETATTHLGRFPLNSPRRLFFPLLLPSSPSKELAFSLSQGRCFLLLAAAVVHTAFFVTVASSRSFPVVVVGFFLNGFAKGNLVSTMNAYMVANPLTFGLGHMHSFFCVGALTSPLICQILIAKGWYWQKFYYISAALPVLNIFIVAMTFHPSVSEFLSDKQRATTEAIEMVRTRRGELASTEDVESVPRQASRHHLPRNMFTTALKTPAVLAFGFFVSMYTGSEGVTSGYIVTYLLRMKQADPDKVGYANSAFWAGAAVGRIALGYSAPHMGKLKPYWIFFFVALAITFHVCIWLVRSFTIGWALTALVGLAMGPVFPLTLEIASRAVTPAVTSSALAIMSSMGNIGGAFYPFLTGILSNSKGPKVIEPLIISLMSTMFCFWGITRLRFPYH